MAEATFGVETTTEVDQEGFDSSTNETTINDTTTVPNVDSSAPTLHYVIWVYLLPVVLLVGIVGNVLSIVVLQSRAFRHTTTAIADTVFILTAGQEILEVAGLFSLREHNVWACRAYKVILYTAGDVSIWLLVAFTFDRFVAVCFPLSKRRVCRWKRAVVASVTILFLSVVKNLHEFWTRGPEYEKDTGKFRRICGTQKRYELFLDYVRPWLAFALITAVPFVLILVFNAAIVHCLIRAQRLRTRAAAPITPTRTPTENGRLPAPPTSGSGFRQTTFMCLGISFAFIICIAPSIVLLIGKPYWKHRTNAAYQRAKAISHFLSILNHCINFVLYCVTGRRFREELRTRLTACGGKRRPLAADSVPQTPISCTTLNDTITGPFSSRLR